MITHAMLLAAGRGTRMGALTDTCPKPLLVVRGKPLIVWHIEQCAAAGIKRLVINHAWLGTLIEQTLGDGSAWGLSIRYCAEPTALETSGGIANALPWLGSAPFAVISSDIFCDFDFGRLHGVATQIENSDLRAWCVLVNNPAHHPQGDFACENGLMMQRKHAASPALTYSGIGVYTAALFADVAPGKPERLLTQLMVGTNARQIGAQIHDGFWTDVGTPERLAQLQ